MNAFGSRLRDALARDGRIHAWSIRQTDQRGLQIYLVETQLESERRVDGGWHEVTVFVRHDGLQGSSTLKFLPGEEETIASRIDQAIYMAGLGGVQPYGLPGPAPLPSVELYDPELAGDRLLKTGRALVEEWRSMAAGIDGVRPSSGEIFCRSENSSLENSSGFIAQSETTQLSLLSILLASSGDREAERVSWEERRRRSDLDLAEVLTRTGEEARGLARATLPPSGKMAVVIDSSEMRALFSPIIDQASAQNIYQGQTQLEVGRAIPAESGGGDPLTLASNAIVPFGLQSYLFDKDGVPGRRVEIVKDGVFARSWATTQFAEYTKSEPTGAFGNLEILPGSSPLEDLLAEGPVLYVDSFSWLTPDSIRGAFSSEIRIGHLLEGKERRPIKGGSVSGNLFSALGAARFAREVVFRGGYLGPTAVRLEGLTVTGA